MRTTVRLDDRLYKRVKRFALENDRTVTSVIEEALRTILGQQKEEDDSQPIRLHTVAGNGVQPGVNLDDTSALLDRMEGA